MDFTSLMDLVSLVSSIASLVLAIVAILAAKSSEKEVRNNFDKTQKMLIEYENRMKETLAEIDKKSAIIENTVSESQKDLMNTMTNIINETVIPKKQDIGEQFAAMFMTQLLSNPTEATSMIEAMKPFMSLANQDKN